MHIDKIKLVNGYFKFIRHPLFLLIISGIAIWLFQQNYLKNEKILERKYEIFKAIPKLHTSYYQESWNQWYAFRDKQPSDEYRRNIQLILVEAKTIEAQLPLLFKDKEIYENWQKFLHIFWEANYPVSREGISEQELNEKLDSVAPLINDIMDKIYKELK